MDPTLFRDLWTLDTVQYLLKFFVLSAKEFVLRYEGEIFHISSIFVYLGSTW